MHELDDANQKPAARSMLKSDTYSMSKGVSTEKVERMKERAKKSIQYDKECDKLNKHEQAEQKKNMKALKFYCTNLREKTCDNVTDMLDGDDGWVQGMSQDAHQ